jgi:hypothetical protein
MTITLTVEELKKYQEDYARWINDALLQVIHSMPNTADGFLSTRERVVKVLEDYREKNPRPILVKI